MLVSDFDYQLPHRLIAQEPAAKRDRSRLLIVNRATEELIDSSFSELPQYLETDDLLVVNNTRVFPARLIGRRLRTTSRGETIAGGRVEVFLVSRHEQLIWEALVKPGRALLPGARVEFARGKLTAEVIEWREGGRRIIRFEAEGDFDEIVDRIGRTPLPPYIKRDEEDRLDAERYQTVFARRRGAVAAPTAGLHFTPELLQKLESIGIQLEEITLHVGYGTFQPVRVERVEDHRVEPEAYSIDGPTAQAINLALEDNRRIVAVGTTTTRALESAARAPQGSPRSRRQHLAQVQSASPGQARFPGDASPRSGRQRVAQGESASPGKASSRDRKPAQRATENFEQTPAQLAFSGPRDSPTLVSPGSAVTSLFIYPGFDFRVLGGLITNFHLPQSSLLMLVSAFAGRDLIMKAYRHAVAHEYRFYSYGDAMLIL